MSNANHPTLFCDDGAEVVLPVKWSICPTCEGHGKSSAYLGAITESDRQCGGIWEDADAFDDYMAGAYDRTCDRCGGDGKVALVDERKLSKAHRDEYREQREADREMRAIEAAERRAGC